ncbi:MAG: lysophospholipid acyltransferase family protein [Pseudomonadota bacterium]
MTSAPLEFKDRLSLALLRFFARLSLPVLQRLGAVIGVLAAHFPRSGVYQTVLRNLQLCYPHESDAWHLATTKASLRSTAMTAFEFAKTWGMPPAYSVSQIREVHDGYIFHEALAAGQGVIAIVPHWGSWEFLNAWINQYTSPVIMYKPGKQPGVDAFVAEARGRLNATVVPTDDNGVRATFKALRKGGFTAILPDHIPGENGGIFAPFFGISTWTGVMVPKLAAKTGCRVIVMGCVRRADGQGFDLHFQACGSDINHADTQIATTAMNRAMEQFINLAPEQYQWSYKRFKRSEHMPNPYRGVGLTYQVDHMTSGE